MLDTRPQPLTEQTLDQLAKVLDLSILQQGHLDLEVGFSTDVSRDLLMVHARPLPRRPPSFLRGGGLRRGRGGGIGLVGGQGFGRPGLSTLGPDDRVELAHGPISLPIAA